MKVFLTERTVLQVQYGVRFMVIAAKPFSARCCKVLPLTAVGRGSVAPSGA
jgi:hypothetical protein